MFHCAVPALYRPAFRPTRGSGEGATAGCSDRSRMFHCAVPALYRPAFRPTRGSGEGATVEVVTGAAPRLPPPVPPEAQADSDTTTPACNSVRNAFIADPI